ncbi:hypothetical protein MC885_019806 [Smutsia gigantea]|nr:hypothetical protein MC885_019806 [Smutsia gigantea]
MWVGLAGGEPWYGAAHKRPAVLLQALTDGHLFVIVIEDVEETMEWRIKRKKKLKVGTVSIVAKRPQNTDVCILTMWDCASRRPRSKITTSQLSLKPVFLHSPLSKAPWGWAWPAGDVKREWRERAAEQRVGLRLRPESLRISGTFRESAGVECVRRVLRPSPAQNGGRETPANDGLGLDSAEGLR